MLISKEESCRNMIMEWKKKGKTNKEKGIHSLSNFFFTSASSVRMKEKYIINSMNNKNEWAEYERERARQIEANT